MIRSLYIWTKSGNIISKYFYRTILYENCRVRNPVVEKFKNVNNFNDDVREL